MPNQSGKIVLVLVLLLLILGVGAYFFLPSFTEQKYQEKSPPSSALINKYVNEATESSRVTRGYFSEALHIRFKIPNNAKIEERFTHIDINIDTKKISVDFNGTNFDNAKEHYEYLKEKNNSSPLSYREGVIGKYDYIFTTNEDIKDKQRIDRAYFIYADYGIYIFSTSDQALYPILDEIVQSFEYKP